MTQRRTSTRTARLYRVLVALIAPCLAYYGIVVLQILSSPMADTAAIASAPAVILLQALFLLPLTMLVGGLIMRRVPGNVVGPIVVLIGALFVGGTATVGRSASLQTITQLFNQSNIALFMLLAFYFPTGRANMARLERVILACALAAPVYALVNLLATSYLKPAMTNSQNPLFVPALAPYSESLADAFPLFFIPVFLGLLALVNRYRTASTHERRQIKWFVWCISTIVPIFIGWMVLYVTGVGEGALYETILLFVSSIWFYAIIPVGVGIAILRHNLYDIDIIIRKTLVYSLLTAILALVYFGGVVLAQQLFRAVAGESSDLAIVLSTLLIAALFAPLRRRIQETIDRRFYRRKYNAQQTLARFSHTLRDEVDIEALKGQLVGVVQETMQPERVGLWLQMEPGGEGNKKGGPE